ncbi:MAG: hypothetical protein OXG92_15520 [Chloroflexi bacterium]|nr:hypothetical protein [Chloroflexota bacterium]MCY3583696.1 hypothetical protein [Chloroflexota bacterium]MCY3717858.1 hypothetical protein [Chloroflexota bacterium]MDE2649786.1 hypothetical protein [Chloroflexota bacterium]MXX50008.1 hypothetical protein [Chloroflexota bacterium]
MQSDFRADIENYARSGVHLEQIIRHEREIGEIRGQLRALATKEFVRSVVQEQTKDLNNKFDTIGTQLNDITKRQQRFKGIGQALVWLIPVAISAVAVVLAVFT